MAISRRQFVVRGARRRGGSLVIGVRLSGRRWLRAQESDAGAKKAAPNPFDAYVHVKPDGQISLIVAKSEMGQGIKTGLAMILAEEAEVDFNSVSVEQAETRPDIYAHMGTGGSGSTMENFTPLRRAGATVRELMITAAAAKWNVSAARVRSEEGQRCCTRNRRARRATENWWKRRRNCRCPIRRKSNSRMNRILN